MAAKSGKHAMGATRELWAWLGMRKTGVVERSHLVEEPRRASPVIQWILSAEERRRGFVRPLRYAYRHERCNAVSVVGETVAAHLARDPLSYDRAYCAHCRKNFPAGPHGEFVWKGSTERVGS